MAVCFANELLEYRKALCRHQARGCPAFSVSRGLIGSGFFLGILIGEHLEQDVER